MINVDESRPENVMEDCIYKKNGHQNVTVVVRSDDRFYSLVGWIIQSR